MGDNKLKVGEKYLTISLFKGQLKLVAFKNKSKENPKAPDYSGDGIAVWINQKREDKSREEEL